MENKKILYIIIFAAIAVILATAVFAAVFFWIRGRTEPPTPIVNESTNINTGTLPNTLQTPTSSDILTPEQRQQLEKEKKFISEYYRQPEVTYEVKTPNYNLPITNIKETVLNFRDFSRTVNTEPVVARLEQNGFALIGNPFAEEKNDWLGSFETINKNNLPIFVSADAALGVYQSTLQVVFREIEEEIFYPSLWQVLEVAYEKARQRYETDFRDLGIESNIASEGSRQEVAYLAVGLKLLEPRPEQTTDQLNDPKLFKRAEAANYRVEVPEYLQDQVQKELDHIYQRRENERSPIFLRPTNYSPYAAPEHYQTSEKLHNYFLATTWLKENNFPLWNKGNNCARCVFDQQDHAINFIAGLYLAEDLSSDQRLQNNWANVYKSISFFRGLENDLTYLEYKQALTDTFGEGYKLSDFFTNDNELIKGYISVLQKKIHAIPFTPILQGLQIEPHLRGLRLLRQQYVFDRKIFTSLQGPGVGRYTRTSIPDQRMPLTYCVSSGQPIRCIATPLDVFAALKDTYARAALSKTNNDAYEKYDALLANLSAELDKLDSKNWHDNAFLSLHYATGKMHEKNQQLPIFMQTDDWQRKTLTTKLAARLAFYQNVTFDKVVPSNTGGLNPYFPYGYVEPQPELYAELIANTNMIIEGFNALQIIPPQSKSYDRLSNLKSLLESMQRISLKHLEGKELDGVDFDFINNYYKQVRSILGDVNPNALQNKTRYAIGGIENKISDQELLGLNYALVIYPDTQGKLYLAIGPVWRYQERIDGEFTNY